MKHNDSIDYHKIFKNQTQFQRLFSSLVFNMETLSLMVVMVVILCILKKHDIVPYNPPSHSLWGKFWHSVTIQIKKRPSKKKMLDFKWSEYLL